MEQEQFNLNDIFLNDKDLHKDIEAIPERFGFKIGDVAKLLKLKPYVLRYWESEFPFLKPKKADNQQRYYTKKDIEKLMIIKKLLYDHKFSIEGARNVFSQMKKTYKKEAKQRRSPQLDIRSLSVCLEELYGKIKDTKNFLSQL